MKCSDRKVLSRPGRPDTRWQAKNSYARIFPSNCLLASFCLFKMDLPILHCTSGAASSLMEETSLPLLWLPLQYLRNGDNVRLCISNDPRIKKERRDAGLGIHVSTGPNRCHAPNVRIFVWNQCLLHFIVCLMCVIFIVSMQMERIYGAGNPSHFYPR